MNSYDEQQGIAFQQDVMASYNEAGHPLDLANVIWSNRMTWDARDLGYPISRAKHLLELRIQLGLVHPNQPIPIISNLVVDGQFFKLSDGKRFTAIEHSDFNLLNRFQHGEDINPILSQRSSIGFNLLRVWTAYDIPNIGTFLDIDYSIIPSFVSLCSSYGLYIEFTAYTGINDPSHWNQLIIASLNCPIKPILELVNELDQNTNEPDSNGRIFNLNDYSKPTGILTSHGSNGSQARPIEPFWDYATFHTNDAPEWWRKVGHNAMEIWDGPSLSNENTRYDHDTDKQHSYDAASGGALLCVGSCCHTVSGKTSVLLQGDELAWATEWAKGAKSVNLSCQQGPYIHRIDLEGPEELRVYERPVSGLNCIVEIRK